MNKIIAAIADCNGRYKLIEQNAKNTAPDMKIRKTQERNAERNAEIAAHFSLINSCYGKFGGYTSSKDSLTVKEAYQHISRLRRGIKSETNSGDRLRN